MEPHRQGFKRKLQQTIIKIPLIAAPLTMLFGMAAGFGAYMYYANATHSTAEAQAAEFNALDKRIKGIAPMRNYVKTSLEQAEVVLKLPADALPAGTDVQKMREQSEKLSSAFEAEVTAAAVDLMHVRHISISEQRDLGSALNASYGKHIPYVMSNESGSVQQVAFTRSCQTRIMSQPGFTPTAETAQQIMACTRENDKAILAMTLPGYLLLAFGFLGLPRLQNRFHASMKKEDELLAAAAGASPQDTPAPVINTATGQDITVKPIKISAKTPGPAA